jgi:cell wall-associated NlpC family hydrolase
MNALYAYAMSFLFIPYKWAGKVPLIGLDCSGLVCEILQAAGILKTNEEMNAQQLYSLMQLQGNKSALGLGSLAFYGIGLTQINHVAFFVNEHLVIEAGHGDSTVVTREDAEKKGAYVRIRPYNYRGDLVAVIRPEYEMLGLTA